MRRKKRRNARRASNKRKSDGERRERERERNKLTALTKTCPNSMGSVALFWRLCSSRL